MQRKRKPCNRESVRMLIGMHAIWFNSIRLLQNVEMASDKFTTCDSTMIPEHLYFFILFLLVLNFFHIFFMRIYSIFSRNTRPLFLWGKKSVKVCVCEYSNIRAWISSVREKNSYSSQHRNLHSLVQTTFFWCSEYVKQQYLQYVYSAEVAKKVHIQLFEYGCAVFSSSETALRYITLFE